MSEGQGGSAVVERLPLQHMRAADADRERVAQRLQRAHAEGRLDLQEVDERMAQVWAARTYGELELVTADLPAGADRSGAGRDTATRPSPPGDGQERAVRAWVTASLVNVVIWIVVCLSTGGWVYPWWVWVAGPWGAVLLAGWVAWRWQSHPTGS